MPELVGIAGSVKILCTYYESFTGNCAGTTGIIRELRELGKFCRELCRNYGNYDNFIENCVGTVWESQE